MLARCLRRDLTTTSNPCRPGRLTNEVRSPGRGRSRHLTCIEPCSSREHCLPSTKEILSTAKVLRKKSKVPEPLAERPKKGLATDGWTWASTRAALARTPPTAQPRPGDRGGAGLLSSAPRGGVMRTERPPTGGRRSRDRSRHSASTVPCSGRPGLEPLPVEPRSPVVPLAQRRGVPTPGRESLAVQPRVRRTGDDRSLEAQARDGRLGRPGLASAPLAGRAFPETPARPWETDGIRLHQEDLRLLALLAEGLPISSVSRRMAMSDRTIRRRIRAVCEQLGVKATVQAIVWAARRGLV